MILRNHEGVKLPKFLKYVLDKFENVMRSN